VKVPRSRPAAPGAKVGAPAGGAAPAASEAGRGAERADEAQIRIEVRERVVEELKKEVVKAYFGGLYVSIEPAEHPWNAWLIRENGAEFRTGAYWDYLCVMRKILRKALYDVEKELKAVEREYRVFVSTNDP